MLRFPHSSRLPIARGLAMFFALFTLLNLVGSLVTVGFDANLWWIDLRFLPALAGNAILAIAALGMFCFAIGVPNSKVLRRLISIVIAAVAVTVFWNAISFYREWSARLIHPGVPIPLSLILGLLLTFILRSTFGPWKLNGGSRSRLVLAAAFSLLLVLFPLAQIYCFGKTDYRRHADAIVVFGARTYSDGTPSWILSERTQTAIDLYQAGLASELIFSGGPGDGATSEPQAMRRLALSRGVPDAAIILDEHGLNTDLTVNHTSAIVDHQHLKTILAVSHFYHLPRVKLAFARALAIGNSSVQILTVPAEENAALPNLPWYISREIAASWAYYLRPLITPPRRPSLVD